MSTVLFISQWLSCIELTLSNKFLSWTFWICSLVKILQFRSRSVVILCPLAHRVTAPLRFTLKSHGKDRHQHFYRMGVAPSVSKKVREESMLYCTTPVCWSKTSLIQWVYSMIRWDGLTNHWSCDVWRSQVRRLLYCKLANLSDSKLICTPLKCMKLFPFGLLWSAPHALESRCGSRDYARIYM